jgi:tellurite resistance-related uncharacterized protein
MYKKTRVFDQNTVPEGLTRNHCTARGVWAMIHILDGSLVYRTISPPSVENLDVDHPAIVAPEELHEIGLCGPVRFYIEFYR